MKIGLTVLTQNHQISSREGDKHKVNYVHRRPVRRSGYVLQAVLH